MAKWSIWRKRKDSMDNKDDMGNKGNKGNIDNKDNIGSEDNMEQTNIPNHTDNLDDVVNTLIAAILECEEYRVYRAELEKVLQSPELKAQIDEYRRRNYELQSSADIDFDKLDRFEKEYENFRSDPLVMDFLEAELAFCKRMQGIETRVTAELDFQ